MGQFYILISVFPNILNVSFFMLFCSFVCAVVLITHQTQHCGTLSIFGSCVINRMHICAVTLKLNISLLHNWWTCSLQDKHEVSPGGLYLELPGLTAVVSYRLLHTFFHLRVRLETYNACLTLPWATQVFCFVLSKPNCHGGK